ncbi:DNA polymerase III subunit delta' [Corynebacterium lizhenjunii]|uniref:DNA polymerase III subunit delta n=1 Tax=Corynebacterium lizhenjunii TaxID=2709394 RepID=A0A7T0KEW4_9CORY|nr:DNA polymerase III subunit delta' [Corynebacterium lizhenjunii]QPK79357.1 DNA polymerase III subunit delta' [Corynebacterium lizhenjunii]
MTSYSTRLVRVNPQNVAALLADTPSVRDTILRAAAAGCKLPGSDPRALAHSWLFTGPPGAGRSTAALALAAALMCTDQPGQGCGACESCRGILQQRQHTDLVFISPQELSIGVAGVREMIHQAASLPTVAPYRVVIFDNADRLTDEAANALLKTVEEPSSSTVLVLCAPTDAPEDFSQTLRSRCRHLYIPAPSVERIVEILQAEGHSPQDARLAAVTSLRHVGRARRLVSDPMAQRRRAAAINLAESVFHGSGGYAAATGLLAAITKEAKEAYQEADAKEIAAVELAYGAGAKGKGAAKAQREAKSAVKRVEELQKKRATRRLRDLLDLALVDLAGIYRDALMVKVGANVEMTHPDFAGLAQELAAKVSEEGLVAAQDAIRTCRNHIANNVGPALAFDGLVGRLRQACGAR